MLADLRERLRSTRWPDRSPGAGWEQGTELDYLRALLAYWADGFDWRAQERELNAFAALQRRGRRRADPLRPRARAARHGIPLILTHGWPSTFVEYLPLVRC